MKVKTLNLTPSCKTCGNLRNPMNVYTCFFRGTPFITINVYCPYCGTDEMLHLTFDDIITRAALYANNEVEKTLEDLLLERTNDEVEN